MWSNGRIFIFDPQKISPKTYVRLGGNFRGGGGGKTM